jgi:catechol 2,3-dioxygenase
VLNAAAHAPRVRATTGLYHFAILVPSRRDLARSLRRLAETETVLQGAADHGVSEALYLADPDGNGIEIYRDRARADWPIVGGQLRMSADPIDLDALLNEAAEAERPSGDPDAFRMAAATTIGHVHLHVSDLDAARRFYVDVIGFDLMQRYGPSALFVAAGGYHHHVGLNTWAGVGAPPPPPGAIGLRYFELKLSEAAAIQPVVSRLRDAGVEVETEGDAALVRDPSSNGILLVA